MNIRDAASLSAEDWNRLVPVMDLMEGQVVHGVGGLRHRYRPLESELCVNASDPPALAAAFRQLGFAQCYVADLDALSGRGANRAAHRAIAEAGVSVWLDQGCALPAERPTWLRPILSCENASSWRQLADAVDGYGAKSESAPIFSLDLTEGRLTSSELRAAAVTPLELAMRVIEELSITDLIVLDVSAVGLGGGPQTLDLCRRIKQRAPQVRLTSGGGVRDAGDVLRLITAGCDFVLVATALHKGRLRLAAG